MGKKKWPAPFPVLTFNMELKFARPNFHEKTFKILFLVYARINFHEETYYKCSARIKFSKFSEKVILPVAIFFSKRLKTSVYKANQKQIKETQVNTGKFLTSSSKISNSCFDEFSPFKNFKY